MQGDLIGTFLRAALEETRAQHDLLILSRSGEHRIAAEAALRHKRIIVGLRDEEFTEALVPSSLLDLIEPTHESLVINNAAARARFIAGPYVRRHKTGSILCLPLLHQARFVGAIPMPAPSARCLSTSRPATLCCSTRLVYPPRRNSTCNFRPVDESASLA